LVRIVVLGEESCGLMSNVGKVVYSSQPVLFQQTLLQIRTNNIPQHRLEKRNIFARNDVQIVSGHTRPEYFGDAKKSKTNAQLYQKAFIFRCLN